MQCLTHPWLRDVEASADDSAGGDGAGGGGLSQEGLGFIVGETPDNAKEVVSEAAYAQLRSCAHFRSNPESCNPLSQLSACRYCALEPASHTRRTKCPPTDSITAELRDSFAWALDANTVYSNGGTLCYVQPVSAEAKRLREAAKETRKEQAPRGLITRFLFGAKSSTSKAEASGTGTVMGPGSQPMTGNGMGAGGETESPPKPSFSEVGAFGSAKNALLGTLRQPDPTRREAGEASSQPRAGLEIDPAIKADPLLEAHLLKERESTVAAPSFLASRTFLVATAGGLCSMIALGVGVVIYRRRRERLLEEEETEHLLNDHY